MNHRPFGENWQEVSGCFTDSIKGDYKMHKKTDMLHTNVKTQLDRMLQEMRSAESEEQKAPKIQINMLDENGRKNLLEQLKENEPMSLKEIKEMCSEVPEFSLTNTLMDLLRMGMIRKEKPDGKVAVYFVTETGKLYIEK